jgi:hypothetical protein
MALPIKSSSNKGSPNKRRNENYNGNIIGACILAGSSLIAVSNLLIYNREDLSDWIRRETPRVVQTQEADVFPRQYVVSNVSCGQSAYKTFLRHRDLSAMIDRYFGDGNGNMSPEEAGRAYANLKDNGGDNYASSGYTMVASEDAYGNLELSVLDGSITGQRNCPISSGGGNVGGEKLGDPYIAPEPTPHVVVTTEAPSFNNKKEWCAYYGKQPYNQRPANYHGTCEEGGDGPQGTGGDTSDPPSPDGGGGSIGETDTDDESGGNGMGGGRGEQTQPGG